MLHPSGAPWTADDLARLTAAYREQRSEQELLRLFPGRSVGAITMQAARLGLKRGSPSEWSAEEIQLLRKLVADRVSWEEIRHRMPRRSVGALREMAARRGFLRSESEYVTASKAARDAKMSLGTMLSLVRYADFYSDPVEKKTEGTTLYYRRSSLDRAILEWIDLMTLREFAGYERTPYTTLQSAMKRMGIRFRSSVDQGHRKLLLSEWRALFDEEQVPEALFGLVPTRP